MCLIVPWIISFFFPFFDSQKLKNENQYLRNVQQLKLDSLNRLLSLKIDETTALHEENARIQKEKNELSGNLLDLHEKFEESKKQLKTVQEEKLQKEKRISALLKQKNNTTAEREKNENLANDYKAQTETSKTKIKEVQEVKKIQETQEEKKKNKTTSVTNSSNTMIKIIAAGKSFQMGSDKNGSDEQPVHTVKFTYDFYISRTEVTQGEYQEITGKNPSYFKGDNLPVEEVSWRDAIKFCNAKSRKHGKAPCYNEKTGECNLNANGYRLPTEAEWEYTARLGLKSKGYNYSGSNTIEKVAWNLNNSMKQTHPVGEKIPNESGIYDMSGNVWEWCNDLYGGTYYELCKNKGIVPDPTGPEEGTEHVLRGGSWLNNDENCRSANRYKSNFDNRSSYIGFRLAQGNIENR